MKTELLTLQDSVLTRKEAEVASLYADGFIGKEIASILGIAYRTVVNHTTNIYDKTQIKRCTNAIAAWYVKTKNGIDTTSLKNNIIAGLFLLIMLPGLQTRQDVFRESRARTCRAEETRRCRSRTRTGNTITLRRSDQYTAA